MNLIADFYKNLDTLNLILFWGIIIVIILLLTFSIILAYKNRKLKEMLIRQKIYTDDTKRDIPIMVEKPEKKETKVQEEVIIPEIKIEEEKNFVAEEHVMEYNKNMFTLDNIEKVNDYHEEVTKPEPIVEPSNMPYQRNTLKERYSSQTSPIGIARRETEEDKTIEKARELNESLNTKEDEYIKENDAYRTAYEIKQEEDAIISFEELMRRKDSIETVDEEDAIISIEELIERKKQEDRLYNITKDAENDNFIEELKDFREDL